MEQYDLPFNKYENPTVELDFDSDEETYYCDVCGHDYFIDEPCIQH